MNRTPQILLTACGGWYLPNSAQAFHARQALAGLWISGKNSSGLPPEKFHRCWPFHLAHKPFLHCAPQIWTEHAFYAFFPLWRAWLARQSWPECDIVHAIMGYASEPFARVGKTRVLKVVDCPNSHPTSYYGYWQRECDLRCPGEKVPIPRWMFARMNRELEQADMILCPSTFVRDTMVQNGISAQKCYVNPFGVNTSVFHKRSSPPPHPRFISVGTICLRKGHHYLFHAFERVKARFPTAELICVGEYKCDFRLERPRWAGRFHHIEHLSHPELAKLLQTATAFVLPSVEEGFARVLSEAMGAGLPIVATYESGATTLVEDSVEGFIVRSRDPQNLAEAMIRIASDPVMNQKMGEAAYQKGAAKNTWQDYGDRLLVEYQRRIDALSAQ